LVFMIKNDAYLYAKAYHKRVKFKFSHDLLEAEMKEKRYTDNAIILVKEWLGKWAYGRSL